MKNSFRSRFLSIALVVASFGLTYLPGARASAADSDYHTFTYDIGVAFGSFNNFQYTEFDVGINAFFARWFAWRNAPFYRAVTGSDNFYGLDSSFRFIYDTPDDHLGFTAFAGPGYRFANFNESAPLVEGGLIFKLAGLRLGGGVKEIFHQASSTGLPNETLLFIVFGGGGAF